MIKTLGLMLQAGGFASPIEVKGKSQARQQAGLHSRPEVRPASLLLIDLYPAACMLKLEIPDQAFVDGFPEECKPVRVIGIMLRHWACELC